MSHEPTSLFVTPLESRKDCRLVERALRAGWLTPERRAGLQKKCWELAEECADQGMVKEFLALANLLEKSYEFDVKVAEREEIRQEKRNQSGQPIPAIQSSPATVVIVGGSFEQQRIELARRIRGDGTRSGNSGGS